MVVLPQPGGPHRISEESLRAASMRPIGPSGAEQMVLAQDLAQRLGPQALGQRRRGERGEELGRHARRYHASAELDGGHHALRGRCSRSTTPAAMRFLSSATLFTSWPLIARHHVARPHEAAGIGAGLHLDDGDAVAPFDQAQLVGDGRRHVDHAWRPTAAGGRRAASDRAADPPAAPPAARRASISLPPRITFTGTMSPTCSVARRKRRLASSSIGWSRSATITSLRLKPACSPGPSG